MLAKETQETQVTNNDKHALERSIIYFSMVTQAVLTFAVVGFCAYQLNRCPVADSDTSDGSGVYDTPSCPRALYTNMITASVAAWFPSPWFSLVQVANTSVPDSSPPTKAQTQAKLRKPPSSPTKEQTKERS